MTSVLDQLNLTPQERRVVVAIAVFVFVLLNWLLVWPHFKDLAAVKAQLAQTRAEIIKENKAILDDVDPNNGKKKELTQLQKQQGGGVVNQQVQLQRSIGDQAIQTGVNVYDTKPVNAMGNAKTNEFYEEQSVKITFDSLEGQLVNFLFNVGNDPAMIRVRELTLRTADANRYRLKGDAILSANYAKQTAAPAATGAAPAGAGKPGLPPPKPLPGQMPIPGPKPPMKNIPPGPQFGRKNL